MSRRINKKNKCKIIAPVRTFC